MEEDFEQKHGGAENPDEMHDDVDHLQVNQINQMTF